MLTNNLVTALLSITAVSYGVNAQSSTASSAAASGSSIPGLTTCIVQCLLQAASTGGCSSLYVPQPRPPPSSISRMTMY